jgi:hypothetical protein
MAADSSGTSHATLLLGSSSNSSGQWCHLAVSLQALQSVNGASQQRFHPASSSAIFNKE